MIYKLEDKVPKLDQSTYVAPGAQIIGNVILKARTSVWFNAVLRGDCDLIEICEDTNIQDGAILHTDPGIILRVGKGVTVGHHAMLHGCVIGDYSLIGINAVVLNGAIIGKGCIIGANALVTERMQVPDYSLVLGSPGKVVKQLPETALEQLKQAADHYSANAKRFANALIEVSGAP